MRTKSNKKYVVVLLIALLFFVSIGYAALSDSLTISGTANLKGVFELVFENASIADGNDKSTVTPAADGKTLTVNSYLTYPGDGESITAVIRNNSDVGAKLENLTMKTSEFMNTGTNTWDDGEVVVTFPALTNCVVPAGGTCSVTFTVAWKNTAVDTYEDAAKTIGFEVGLDYVQAETGPYAGQTAHSESN